MLLFSLNRSSLEFLRYNIIYIRTGPIWPLLFVRVRSGTLDHAHVLSALQCHVVATRQHVLHVLVTGLGTHLAAVLGTSVAARHFVLARRLAAELFFGHVARHLLRVTALGQRARHGHVTCAAFLQSTCVRGSFMNGIVKDLYVLRNIDVCSCGRKRGRRCKAGST